MAEVTSEWIYEVLKQLQDRMSSFEKKMDEVKSELQALRIHSIAMQQDIQNIYATFVRQEARLDRIERRLEFAEVSG
jgi:tetrahydromethanopterin S-methyltransferase subunit G